MKSSTPYVIIVSLAIVLCAGLYYFFFRDVTPPSIPAGLSGAPNSSSEIDLAWAPSMDNIGVAGYYVYRNGSRIGDTIVSSFKDKGLEASTTYAYAVSAFDVAGNISPQSAGVSKSTPSPSLLLLSPAPSDLVASYINLSSGSAYVALTWKNNAADAIGFTVERGTNGVYYYKIATTAATSFSYKDFKVSSGTPYFYRVSTFNKAGSSLYSNIATLATPGSASGAKEEP